LLRTHDAGARGEPAAVPGIDGAPPQGETIDYRLGAAYSLVTAALLALQEPFSALAARKLDSADFVAFTQASLLASIPLLLVRPEARRDFAKLLTTPRAWPKFAVLLAVGLTGLELYDLGLSSAHPIITAAVLNLSPFWAAVVAFAVSRKPLPGSPGLFCACFSFAFLGAMAIAWSQINLDSASVASAVLESALHSHWIYALPMPLMFALSGTLVYVWFRDYDESAAVGANFLVSAVVLIPAAAIRAHESGGSHITWQTAPAIVLLLIGTLASSAAGRVFYQSALSATHNDNGFVTMFFLVIPAMSALASWPLSAWISDLSFLPNAMFFAGLALVSAPLLIFARSSMREKPDGGA
jgi:drug/metabolite transporter (DMT)-like permease